MEAHVFRAAVAHQLTDEIKANISASYGDYDKVYSNFYAAAYDAETNIATLDGYIDTTQRDNLILSANLIAEIDTGDIEHTIIVGSEYIKTNSDQDRINPIFSSTGNDKERFIVNRPLDFRGLAGVNADGINVTASLSNIDDINLNDDTHVNLDVTSFYIQDEIRLTEQFHIVLGARFDRFDISVFNAKPDALETRERTDSEVSPRAGIIYKPSDDISLYASYSESFLPRSGEQYTDINGDDNQLDPDTFTNQEIGIKWDFADGLSFTAALFENEQSSPQVADSDPSTLDVIDSEISGFELQLNGQINDDWSIHANYSNMSGEIVDRNGPTGRDPRELPDTTYSVWSTYQVNDVFGFGLGVTYQDESFINTSNSAVLPSYTRIDAYAHYDVSDDLRLQLNIENLTDELYFPNAHSTHQVTVAAPINAMLTVVGSF